MIRETITLTPKEQHRAHVLARVQHGVLPATEAAVLLGLSLRHLRRLLARLRQQGLAALAPGNRRPPPPPAPPPPPPPPPPAPGPACPSGAPRPWPMGPAAAPPRGASRKPSGPEFLPWRRAEG